MGEGRGDGFESELQEQLKSTSELEAQLDEEKKKADEYLDNWRRTAAEFQNFKRRAEKDKADYGQYANQRLLKRVLDVLDSFDAGFKAVPDEYAKEPWVEGMRAVERQLLQILEGEGVTPIDAAGKEFDPNFHEAMLYEPSPGSSEGQILDELQRGYMLHDRVLRPSRVKVAKGE
ncbi:MAG TPA: nucleotide exchange factor GrpE [Anaerolineae bacterium]|nr:nucleotide exchange factor GrpE [Anaerolineae bacterium]